MTFGDLFTLFPSIYESFAPWYNMPKLSILIFSVVPGIILLTFYVFSIVLPFPIRISWFLYCRLYIFMYTSLFNNRIQLPLHFWPYSHSGPLTFIPIRLAHLGTTSQTPPFLLRTDSHPLHIPAPAIAIVCLFWAWPAVGQRIILEPTARVLGLRIIYTTSIITSSFAFSSCVLLFTHFTIIITSYLHLHLYLHLHYHPPLNFIFTFVLALALVLTSHIH